MEDRPNQIETLFQRTEEYVKTSLEIFKLRTLEKTTEVASSAISRYILIMVVFMCLFVLSIGVSFWLGEMLEKIYYGFLIVGGFWAVAGVVIYFFFYKKIKKFIGDSIIRNVN